MNEKFAAPNFNFMNGYSFSLSRPSPMSEEALEDSIKLAQMKAKKAR